MKVDPLKNWATLNVELMKIDDERTLARLLRRAKRLGKPPVFVMRIHARFSRVRRARETRELTR